MKISTYLELLKIFEEKQDCVDELGFYFKSDSNETERYIGCNLKFDKPYWAGYCDASDGLEFKTAQELLEANIWDGKSIKDRFEEITIFTIDGLSLDDIEEL